MTGSEALLKTTSRLPSAGFAGRRYDEVVKIGHEVRLLDCQVGAQATITIVPPEYSSPERGLVSCISPLGASLLGGKVGDSRQVQIFGRNFVFTILNVR